MKQNHNNNEVPQPEGRPPVVVLSQKIYTVTDQMVTTVTSWIAGVILIVLFIWGAIWIWDYFKYEDTNDAQVQEYINPLISRAGGFIVAMKFEENEYKKKGDTLLLIDNREYVIQQHQTEAALVHAEAQLLVLASRIATLERTAAVNKTKITATKAEQWKQQLDYDRYNQLYTVESATSQTLEENKAAFDVAIANTESAKEAYEASLSSIDDVKTERLVVKAEIQRLKALLDRHLLDVSYTIIIAPYDCRIGRRTIEVGQMIDAGQVLAYIVNNETDKWVVANYKETQIAKMYVGQGVRFTADAYPGQIFKAKIISLSPATGSSFSLLPPDNSTGNYVKIVQRVPVRIKVLGSKKEIDMLKVGMNVNVRINKHK